ncbi:hypothetical protein TNCV_3888431 [Trichonephila clavipes]|nr:hypothetical protein TNCV_3888431 [Trichonephila clavipes]
MVTPPISTSTILPWDWRGEKYSPVPCARDSAHKTFGTTDLTTTYSVCTRSVFGGIGHRTQVFRSGVRCSNHQATHGPGLFCRCGECRRVYQLRCRLRQLIETQN